MKKQRKQIKLVVKGGIINAIYDDALTPLFTDAEVTIERASHVEPHRMKWGDGDSYWQADLTPVGGPMLVGFTTRKDALAAEAQYLNRHVII